MEREPEQLFLDDFSAGQTYPGQPRTITKDDILSFAALTGDAHPIHYDDEYAKSTRFGRPIVHGLHLMALTALGATPLSAQLADSMIAMLEQQATFRKPVFKDDTLRPQIEIEAIDRLPGKDWGKLAMKVRRSTSARKSCSKAGTCTWSAAAPNQKSEPRRYCVGALSGPGRMS
jgi:3-hydroxybutyryl-CoA dehydratase